MAENETLRDYEGNNAFAHHPVAAALVTPLLGVNVAVTVTRVATRRVRDLNSQSLPLLFDLVTFFLEVR